MEEPPCKRHMFCVVYGQRMATDTRTDHSIIEGLKLEIISVLKSDQFHILSMHLSEMFVGKDMKVGTCRHMTRYSLISSNFILDVFLRKLGSGA